LLVCWRLPGLISAAIAARLVRLLLGDVGSGIRFFGIHRILSSKRYASRHLSCTDHAWRFCGQESCEGLEEEGRTNRLSVPVSIKVRFAAFKKSDDVGRSLSVDRRKNAKTKTKSGQGDKGDR
jgi:hypothetical protein